MFKRNKVLLLALASALVFFFSFYCKADTLGTSNCSTDGSTNFVTGNSCASGTHTQTTTEIFNSQPGGAANTGSSTVGDFSTMTRSGSTSHIRNWNYSNTGLTPELWFQHTQDTWAVQIAITNALASAGIKVDGYTAHWEVNNTRTNTIYGNCQVAKTNGQCVDPLTIT